MWLWHVQCRSFYCRCHGYLIAILASWLLSLKVNNLLVSKILSDLIWSFWSGQLNSQLRKNIKNAQTFGYFWVCPKTIEDNRPINMYIYKCQLVVLDIDLWTRGQNVWYQLEYVVLTRIRPKQNVIIPHNLFKSNFPILLFEPYFRNFSSKCKIFWHIKGY